MEKNRLLSGFFGRFKKKSSKLRIAGRIAGRLHLPVFEPTGGINCLFK
jgi:hypothetical protein